MSTDVTVEQQAGGEWLVGIRLGDGEVAELVVSVPPGFPATVGWTDADAAALVTGSVRYLLEREHATSILRRFSLDDIARYFPEYPAGIRRRAPAGPPVP